MKRFFAIVTAAVLTWGAVFTPAMADTVNTAEVRSTVSAPMVDQESGLHNIETDSLAVHLTTDTPNAVIYYKIDDGSYTKYNGAVNITKNCRLYTYAELSGTQSSVAEYEYRLGAKFNWSVKPGSYTENQIVKVTTNVPGAKLYYSVDGKQVTKDSKEIPTNGVSIENTTSFSVLSVKDGWSSVGNVYTFNINKLNNDRLNHLYYDQLSDKQKELYDRVYAAMQSGITDIISIGDLGLDSDSASQALEALNKERCTLVGPDHDGHWYTRYVYTTSKIASGVKLNYSINDPYIISAQKKFDEAADKIIEEAKKQPTSYEKLKFIHDWIIDNVTYLSSAESNWVSNYADAPIVKGFGNCNGYARAFTYLAQALGFDCFTLGGSVGEGALHAWNKVKLDGEWYNVDVCWDDRGNKIYYDYFLVCDEQFHKNHTPLNWEFMKSAAYNYDLDAKHDLSDKIVRGDINKDGIVNIQDVVFLLRAVVYNTTSQLGADAEFTGDGKITIDDVVALLRGIVFGTL